MVRWLAPILSFTADEIWKHLKGAHGESVFLETWHPLPETPVAALDWPALIGLRADVAHELEPLRAAGAIGGPLDAEVDLYCTPEFAPRFAALGPELRFVLIVSEARVHTVNGPPPGAVPAAHVTSEGVWLTVAPSTAVKCVRCWHHRPDVGIAPEHPELCGRCVQNLGVGETRRFA
jgi:isoleucyl-tRNA synthetase